MTRLLRWILVPLSGIAVFYAVFAFSILGYRLLARLCPAELVESGCIATWHDPAVEVLKLTCAAVASAGVVLVPALVAPSRRFAVAAFTFALGAAAAFYLSRRGPLWGPLAVAA